MNTAKQFFVGLLFAMTHLAAMAAGGLLLPPLPKQPPSQLAPVGPTSNTGSQPTTIAFGPKWPVSFNLQEGESEGWGFAVGQPGTVNVRAQSQGGPIIVSVHKPDGSSVEQVGSGQIDMTVQATQTDVSRSVLWGISVRGASPPMPAVGVRELRPVARGTVTVEHPPADAKRSEAEVKSIAGWVNTQKMQISNRSLQARTQLAQASQRTVQSKAISVTGAKTKHMENPPVPQTDNHNNPPKGNYWLFGLADTNSPVSYTWLMERRLANPVTMSSAGYIEHAGEFVEGKKGDDEFFSSTPLKNGWLVDHCAMFDWAQVGRSSSPVGWALSYPVGQGQDGLTDPYGGLPWFLLITSNLNQGNGPSVSKNIFGGGANATIVDCSIGTASPYVKVHWWTEAGASVSYNVGVFIHGPSGMPFR